MSPTPRVSIGLPVYHGERFLAEALRDLLAQTHTDFELIISDNASTDGTEAIGRRHAAADARIRYVRQPENRGAMRNFEEVRDLARGEFFLWAAHDDRWHPDYVAACVAELDRHPEAVLCSSWAQVISAEGERTRTYTEDMTTLGLPRLARLARVLEVLAHNIQFYGVTRTAVARRVRLRQHYGFDHAFTLELSLQGAFITIPRPLFLNREGGIHASTVAIMQAQNIRGWWTRYFPTLAFQCHLMRDAAGWGGLSAAERLQAVRLVRRRFRSPYYRKRIRDEVAHVAMYLPRRLRRGRGAEAAVGGRAP